MTWNQLCKIPAQFERYRQASCKFLPLPKTTDDEMPPNIEGTLAARLLCTEAKDLSLARRLLERIWDNFKLEMDIDQALALRWHEVAVPTLRGNTACLAFVLLAALPEGAPDHRLSSRLSGEAAVVRQALNLARDRTGRVFFAHLREEANMQGESLGLPVYLGAVRLCLPESRLWPPFLATGALTGEKKVEKVSFVREKATLCKNAVADIFLYPAGNEETVPGNMNFAVASLEDAEWLLGWQLHSPDSWKMLRDGLSSPVKFWNYLPHWGKEGLPAALDFMERCGLLDQLSSDEKAGVLGVVCDFLENRDNRKWQEKLLPVFPHEWAAAQPPSRELFRLAQLWITFLNHSGNVVGAARWEETTENCRTAVTDDDDWRGYRTRQLVARHNRYLFAEIPADLLKDVEAYVAFNRQREADDGYGTGHESLGKAFGILCQNEAFCGRTDEALHFAQRSCEEFAKLPSGKVETRRRLADKASIFWDAGRPDEARAAVAAYFDGSIEAAIAARDIRDGFGHALLARLFLEEGKVPPAYAAWARDLDVPPYHPWQLWTRNMGVALGEAALLQRSVEICLKQDATVLPMTLPALTALRDRAGTDSEAIETQAETILRELRDLCAKGTLDAGHFAELLACQDGKAALDFFREEERIKAIFPFNYR